MKNNYLYNRKIYLYGKKSDIESVYAFLDDKVDITGVIHPNGVLDIISASEDIIVICDNDLEKTFTIKKELYYQGYRAVILDELLELLDFQDLEGDNANTIDSSFCVYGAGINYRRNYRVLKNKLNGTCVYDGDRNKENMLTCGNKIIKYKDSIPDADGCIVFTDKIDAYNNIKKFLRFHNINRIALADSYVRGLADENN